MQSFELQVYKGGKWEFDSHFDDRETALFEAERLNDSDRYNGIRILEELFRDGSDTSECNVIFSRLKKIDSNDDPRTQASHEAYRMAVREVTKPDREKKGAARNSRKSKSSSKKGKVRASAKSRNSSGSSGHTSFYKLIVMAVLIVIIGVGAMIGLRYMAVSM